MAYDRQFFTTKKRKKVKKKNVLCPPKLLELYHL